MKNSPKNFYNVVDKKKLGIDEALAVAGEVEQLQTTVGDSSSGLVKQVNDLQHTVDNIDYDISRKADIDGTYPDLTAGKAITAEHAQNAEQLDSTVSVEDSEPYNFRTSGGANDIGNRENDQLIGGSIAWNQLVNTTDTSVTVQSGHKLVTYISGSWDVIQSDGNAITVDGSTDMVFDITIMLGVSAADAIYAMETGTPGNGVSYFRKFFPKAAYEYDPGTIMSVKTSAHVMVGFNAYDHVSGEAKLVGGNQYQITGTYTALAYEDIDGNAETITPDASGLFTPIKSGILTVTGGNDTDTCVHLTWSGYRNGEFEPYIKRSYSLDDDLELRGVTKVDGYGNLYYDGDTYDSDGTVTRRYGIVDLSTLSWTYQSNYTRFFTKGIEDLIKSMAASDTPNLICSKYYIAHAFTGAVNKQIYVGTSGSLFIKDYDYTTEEAFTAALSGVYLVYELATPTTESAEAYPDPQWVDDFGTEEYVDTRSIPVPVGHNTIYPANLRDKLQHLPDPTGVNGTYIIREENEKMTLVPDQIPALPTTDGTYVLTCTVSDGTATIEWTSNA